LLPYRLLVSEFAHLLVGLEEDRQQSIQDVTLALVEVDTIVQGLLLGSAMLRRTSAWLRTGYFGSNCLPEFLR
jgi:hypothetical protein